MVKCQDCKKRDAVVKYSDEPTFALTHGCGIVCICRECFIARIRDAIKALQENLRKQRAILLKKDLTSLSKKLNK